MEPTRTINADGTQEWAVNGQYHRLNGPAYIRTDGTRAWWVRDQEITQEVKAWMIDRNVTWPWDEDTQIQFLLAWS